MCAERNADPVTYPESEPLRVCVGVADEDSVALGDAELESKTNVRSVADANRLADLDVVSKHVTNAVFNAVCVFYGHV